MEEDLARVEDFTPQEENKLVKEVNQLQNQVTAELQELKEEDETQEDKALEAAKKTLIFSAFNL